MALHIRESMASMVEVTGGEVSEKRFVEKPGIVVLNPGDGLTEEAKALIRKFNINTEQSAMRQLGAVNIK